MPLNIRSFLKKLVASIAAGTLFSNETQALLAQAPPEFNKFAEVVNQCKVIVETNTAWRQHRIGTKYGVNPLMSNLLDFMADNFQAPPLKDTEGFNELLRDGDNWFGRHINCLDEQSLRRVVECMVPVAVMRSLLANYKVIFDPSDMAGWRVFADRYQDLILAV